MGFGAETLRWVVSAWAVAFGGFLLFGGRAVDRIGARRVFLAAFAVYGVASLAGGLADGPGLLVAARAVQGLGGAPPAGSPRRRRSAAHWPPCCSSDLQVRTDQPLPAAPRPPRPEALSCRSNRWRPGPGNPCENSCSGPCEQSVS
jgi:hypothetical protein